MAGHPIDEDKRSLRLAQITQYVEQLYTDRFEEWILEDASRLDLVARHAMAVADYKTARLPVTATFLEAWTEFKFATSEDERRSLICELPTDSNGGVSSPPAHSEADLVCARSRQRTEAARLAERFSLEISGLTRDSGWPAEDHDLANKNALNREKAVDYF
jgi:hypothetical protein